MSTSARIGFGLAAFYTIAAVAYYLTGHDLQGFPLLLTGAVGIGLIGGYAALAVRKAERQLAAQEEERPEEEPHVGPTIWPFGYAVAAIAIVIGSVLNGWVLVLGGILFVAATVGWFVDVRRQWRHPADESLAVAGHGVPAAGGAVADVVAGPESGAPTDAASTTPPMPSGRHRRRGGRDPSVGGPG